MAGKRFTPSPRELQEFLELPENELPELLLAEEKYLAEALAAVRGEIAEYRVLGHAASDAGPSAHRTAYSIGSCGRSNSH